MPGPKLYRILKDGGLSTRDFRRFAEVQRAGDLHDVLKYW